MPDRNYNQERQRRQTDNDWTWDYYYEYRYLPYSPYRRNDYDYYAQDYYDRDYYGPNYYHDRDRHGASNYGRYTGVGPRGYQRSDERIDEDVNDRLTWHGDLDATDIHVDVDDGVVTLTGEVNSRYEKRLAEDTAEGVPGVWDVDNQLKVRRRNHNKGRMENNQIRPGMEVVGRDSGHVGEVKEVRSNDFLVDRPMERDVYIPFSACEVTGGQIRLNVRSDEINDQGWEMPDLLETTQKSHKRR